MNYEDANKINRQEVEHDFSLLGFLIVENKLKEATSPVIDTLHKANVRTVMVTGDNVLTAISVARQCNIVKHGQKVYLGDLSEEKDVDGNDVVVW
mmetsp:Transcript_15333/g.13063  ORF Transcript_15333/g.13063 Transcript_15333/m.13063 type:complete len:95 (+) Transcript_15333:152-436(+)|eukprot:CAMPEP_0114580678 /NCGR_PEP_ID=MMETSP0125-20121206/4912_1 /TAXON_ID=485358 ORGANISM="Aristerostoma sp., Strain ATCC 50986" /NCGR_SAMPLE_ID=MMETSP0125 /ASSEMBLY_ACC=CAM_ASM_000245 /LENGTH=94 /DNA_ID=CAMNT_0001772377 /DNA_START=1986 /DNA_END=2267 /DNA_ORIENTATION=+